MARANSGIGTRGDLLEAGLSRAQIDYRIASGLLVPLFRGVYAIGNPVVNDIVYLRAALWSVRNPEAFLSGNTGEAAYKMRRLNRRKIEISIPGRGGTHSRIVTPSGGEITLHRARSVHLRDVTTRNGLRVATFPRLLVDRAGRITPAEVEELCEQAVRKSMYHPLGVEAAIERAARRPGIAMLRAAAVRYRPGPDRKSGLERSFDRWKRTRPDLPEPDRNVILPPAGEIDCLWPEYGVALELDGRPYHTAVRDFDADSLKQGRLLVMEYRPMRVTDFRWEYDRPQVVEHLEALLRLGGWRG